MTAEAVLVRYRIHVYGLVQGVGFRPFVYRLAREMGLAGSVSNSTSGAFIEAEGEEGQCALFVERLRECPPPAWVAGSEVSVLDARGLADFHIADSNDDPARTASILPDLATCPDCLSELFDPKDRRHLYPFLNCTCCGPRFTIVLDLPYDRHNTTMRCFHMCDACRAEYTSPSDRRFHAQPTACPACGPTVREPLSTYVDMLRRGLAPAIKGIGGFQILVDAQNEEAVRRLRRRKHRDEKPFAVMFPTLDSVREYCHVSDVEARVLASAAAPIVLLAPRKEKRLAPSVPGCSPWIGAMLPYSPLHHLLLHDFGGPVVATSGNLAEEPIITDNGEANDRLHGVADLPLLHDRDIARHADDSVVRVVAGREVVLRRARGYAPMPVRVRRKLPRVLALGGHMKSTVAIGQGETVTVSQHIGDLDSPEARDAFVRTIEDFKRLYRFEPEVVACDLHPDYYSSIYAGSLADRVIRIQHHHAHVAACAAENDIDGDYLGVAWDGTGYGLDATIWGGEFFVCTNGSFERVAHLRPFRLQGGERAVRDCRRAAASLLRESDSLGIVTTSAGRLFDAVASITDIAQTNAFEGQAPMMLEGAATPTSLRYELPLEGSQLDWRPLIAAIAKDALRRPASEISYAFHQALADAIVHVAKQYGLPVVLSGGVFQNVLLVNMIRAKIDARTHWRVPPNDGGIALGQAVIAGSLCA